MKRLLIVFVLLLLCGCSKNTNLIHEHCTRNGSIENGSVNLEYDLYSSNDVLLKLESNESVISDDSSVLDTYQDAYQKIHSYYKNLEYYHTKINRDDTSITSVIVIEYDKIDIDKLIEIEGEEDNIFDGKTPKASKWKEFAKKVGTSCSVVND